RNMKHVLLTRPRARRSAAKSALDRSRAVGGRPRPVMKDQSGDQALAALGTSCLEHFATIGRGHARAETVLAGTLEIAGLEGPLHGLLLSNEMEGKRCGSMRVK